MGRSRLGIGLDGRERHSRNFSNYGRWSGKHMDIKTYTWPNDRQGPKLKLHHINRYPPHRFGVCSLLSFFCPVLPSFKQRKANVVKVMGF